MAKNDELAARYPDLVGDATQADSELIETVRALDALYAAEAPAALEQYSSRLAQRPEMTSAVEAPSHPPRREGDSMRLIRTSRGRRWTGFAASAAACVVVGLLAALLIGGRGGPVRSGPGGGPIVTQGGLSITALTGCASPSCSLTPVLGTEIGILSHRFADVLGVHDATITLMSASEIDIELPGVTDVRSAVPLLGAGSFQVLDTGSTYLAPGTPLGTLSARYRVVFTGTQVDPTTVSFATDPQTGQKVVTFAFKSSAQQAFALYTAQHIGQYLTIALDGSVIESAVIQSAFGGTVQLIGLSQEQTPLVATALKYGALPEPIRVVKVSLVSPGGKVTCGSGTPAPTAYPSDTPTPPPDATPEPPTPTPWPNPTPIPTGTTSPAPTLTANGSQYILIESGCGTPTPGPTGTIPPTPHPVWTPTAHPGPTPLPTPTAIRVP